MAIGANPSISVMEAIKLYTWNGDFASFEEETKGSIVVGKLAEIVKLNNSILSVNPNQIKELKSRNDYY
jgi:predicted amidohydrolase YtcJ